MWACALNSKNSKTLGKDKLKRFRELESLDKVIQPDFDEVFHKNYRLKGRWTTEVFGNDRPLVLELGCGGGEYTLGLARKYAERNFLGLDIKGARIWKGATAARKEGLDNVAFLRTRIDFISSFFARNEVEEIWITFPDPQERRRRLKKRLTGALYLNYYRQFLRDGGLVHLKTDNLKLYQYTLELARRNNLKIGPHSEDISSSGWDNEITAIKTYYESCFAAEGTPIKYISFQLHAQQEIKELSNDEEVRIYGEG